MAKAPCHRETIIIDGSFWVSTLQRQQAIRFANTLLAAVGGAVLTTVVIYAQTAGDLLVNSSLLTVILTLFWGVNVLFIAVIKSGWNLRFSEPALTLPQMVWASSSALIALLVSQYWDGAYYLLVLLTILFGVFRVELRAINVYCGYIVLLSAVMVCLRYWIFDLQRPLLGTLLLWFTFAFCALALARLCHSIMTLRNRLRDRNEELREALKARSYFLANMSHEIRTPMNGVLGMLDIVLRSDLSVEQRRFLSIAQGSANGLLTIINDILDFSKIEAGKLRIEEVDFNLNQFIQEIIVTFSARAQEKGLELILDMSPELPEFIHADPVRLRQILNNLLGNALKFTEQGEIVLRVSAQGETELLWQVEDTGIGIEESKQAELFDSFTQADVSTTRVYGGTGLGLAICKQLCELMHGYISVTSKLSRGSCFKVCLPYQFVELQAVTNMEYLHLKGRRVLVVDDSATNRLILREQLQAKGVVVDSFESASEALSYLAERPECQFDLAILDMQMPHWDGVMLAKQIRKLPQYDRLILIILTSLLEEVDKAVLEQLHISACLNKPIQPVLLYKTLSVALAQPTKVLRSGDILALNNSEEHGGALVGCRVLLVEDNAVNREIALMALEDMGLQVDIAVDGEQAIAKLQGASVEDQMFSLVLMDCQMPIMDGYEATGLIRQHPDTAIKNIPVIAMTANAMAGDREKCIAAGMNDYVSKPIQFELLQKTLARWHSTRTE